jgi:hypothetical protein
LGSQSTSKFRIVAGGMFGSNTLEEDQKSIGIQVSQTRNCKANEWKSPAVRDDDDEAMHVSIVQSLDLIDEDLVLKAVVVCGYEDKDKCSSLKALASEDRVKDVVTIWACPSLLQERDPTDFTQLYECERSVESLLASHIEEDEFDLLVLDPSATFEMAQILISSLSHPDNREEIFSNKHLILSFLQQQENQERWRREFVEQYRKFKHENVLFRVEIAITTSQRELGLELLYCGDKAFDRINGLEESLASVLPEHYGVKVVQITGGLHFYDTEYNLVEFPETAYNRIPATLQGQNQKALGRQTIFQFEYQERKSEVDDMPTLDQLVRYLNTTMGSVHYSSFRQEKFTNVGDGVVLISHCEEALALLIWDGKDHVDVNLFSSDQNEDRANQFAEQFGKSSGLSLYLRDDQPRGTGKVMQFSHDEQFR